MADGGASRWSKERYTNPEVPSYVPPEAFTHLDGQFMRAFRLRALIHDFHRIVKSGKSDQCFVNVSIEPKYNATGGRVNTPEDILLNRRMAAIKELSRMHSTFGDHHETKGKTILRKVRLSREVVETGSWGALIGARGMVHQQMEKDYNCHIVLAGRGITDPVKDTNPNALSWAQEDPHVRITANNEQDLQAAVERIEWILSDDPEAVEFREINRRRTAQVEGRYDPSTWVSSTTPAAAAAGAGAGTKKGKR
eukprot:gene6750-4842_t